MIVKCNLHQSAPRLTEYLINQAGNERIEIVANHGSVFTGLTPEDARLASKVMNIDFQKTAGKYPCYHVQISPGKGENLTPTQIPRTIDTYLQGRNLAGRAHLATVHYKPDGSMHLHLQISRYDPKTGKLDKNKMWRDEHDAIRSKLEIEFGHARTPQRNLRRPEIKCQVTDLYGQCPQDFVESVNKLGYAISKGGDPHHLWQLVDSMAVAHPLTNLITQEVDGKAKKITKKELSDYLKGITFPNLKQALELQNVAKAAYQSGLKWAAEEAKMAEQFDYSPDSRPAKKQQPNVEVADDSISKKQDAFLGAINQFKKQEADKEERERKVKEALDSLDDIFAIKKRKRGLSL